MTIPDPRLVCLPLLLGTVLLLTGCETTPPTRWILDRDDGRGVPASSGPQDDVPRFADPAVTARNYVARARQALPPEQDRYRLAAAAALLRAGRSAEAREQLEQLDPQTLSPGLAMQRRLLNARIALAGQRPNRAMRELNALDIYTGLEPARLAEYFALRARAEQARGNPLAAVRNFAVRTKYLRTPPARRTNQQNLWRVLTDVDPAQLQSERDITHDPVLRGWLELALLEQRYLTGAGLTTALANWRSRNARHPGKEFLSSRYGVARGASAAPPRTLALLLPISSRFSQQASAVYDALMAMHRADSRPDRPTVVLYDIGDDPMLAPAYYRRALDEGAQLVVGPLGRDAVAQVVSAGADRPTLLLSDTGMGRLPPHLNQFSLSAEGEARQAAERAYLDGYRRAAVLFPLNKQGQRMEKAFADRWRELGAEIVESQGYLTTETDYSYTIKRLLNINDSETRRRLLTATLNARVKFEPRRRQDVDLIFLPAGARDGRLLGPQIRFHRALDVPMYSTSRIYSGTPAPRVDADLNGILFGDMPWLLSQRGRIQTLRQQVQGAWPNKGTALDRLYGFGIDAYRLALEMRRLRDNPFQELSGVTGTLRVNQDGRVQRRLRWARFRKGVPKLISDPIDSMDLTAELSDNPDVFPRPARRDAGL